MSKHITLFIAGDTSSRIRKLTVPVPLILVCATLFCIVVVCFGLILTDYFGLKEKRMHAEALRRKAIAQQDEIVSQRKQIRQFAGEINNLKARLVALTDFENKIKVIANIEDGNDRDNLFGVGGTIPGNLYADFNISKSHSSLIREMHDQVNQLSSYTESQKRGFNALLDFLENKKNILASTPAIWPTTGWVTSRFGYRKSPFTGLKEFHKGIDISTRIGTPITAPADGTIAFCGKKGFMGKAIVIDHGHGMTTRFGHIYKFMKKRGDRVKRGDVIAQVGNTGRSTGPHLHYDIRLNGISVNPEKYILN